MTPVSSYRRVLFVGPDLRHGSLGELFQRQLAGLRGEGALADIIDTAEGFDGLWATLGDCLAGGQLPLLLIDLDPQTSGAYLDWLRSELQRRAAPFDAADALFVATAAGREPGLTPEGACALIERRELHLGCSDVAELPERHDWSRIPPHRYRVLLCNGPRCTRRGALPLWKSLRQHLVARGRLDTADGVHITRTQCQFPCDQGPTLSVYPPGAWYRVASEADVIRLVEEQLVEGREVPELLMVREEQARG